MHVKYDTKGICAVRVEFDVEDGVVKEARLVFGGVAPVPYELTEVEEYLIGKKLDKAVAKEASEIALAKALPMGKNEYKVFLAKDVVYEAVCRAAGIEKVEIPVL